MNISQIFKKLGRGGLSRVAKDCGVSVQAASHWGKINSVPAKKVLLFKDALEEYGITVNERDIRPDVFIPPKERKPDNSAKSVA